MTIGESIKIERKKAGLTQKELGQKIGVTHQTIAQWENGWRNPKIETVEKIADALEIGLFDLMGHSSDVAPVVHGRWENGCVCSNCTTHCGPRNKTAVMYYRYCPFCGAKMDLEAT